MVGFISPGDRSSTYRSTRIIAKLDSLCPYVPKIFELSNASDLNKKSRPERFQLDDGRGMRTLLLLSLWSLGHAQCVEVSIVLEDAWGDGWNGATYELVNDFGIYGNGTLESGANETHVYCLEPGCYGILVDDGSEYPLEVSYTLQGITVAGGNTSTYFQLTEDTVIENGCAPSPMPTTVPTPEGAFFAAFDTLQSLVDSGTPEIALTEDVFFRTCDPIQPLHQCILIESAITIDGTYALDGRSATPLLEVRVALTLRGVQVRNADYGGAGAGVFVRSDANLTLTDVTMTNCRTGVNGGGIYADPGAFVVIFGGFYSRNAALDGAGGVFAGMGATLLIENATFDGNEAWSNGGAIDGIGLVSLTVRGGLFTRNFAGDGGCIHATATPLLIEDAHFENNSVWGTVEFFNNRGGALLIRESDSHIIRRSTFRGNFGIGAAMRADTIRDLRLEDCLLDKNRYHPGAVLSGGGAIDLASAHDLRITNLTATDNHCDSSLCDGAVLRARTSQNIVIDGSTFSSNGHTDGSGGVLSFTEDSRASVQASLFESNFCTEYGAVIYAVGIIDLNISTSTFRSNWNLNNAGSAIYFSSPQGRFRGGFVVVSGHTGGSPIYLEDDAESDVRGLTCENNTALDASGGCLHVVGGSLNVLGSTFRNNGASDGGAVSLQSCTAFVDAVDFVRNTAVRGGAIDAGESDVVFSGTNLTSNVAETGGAVSCDNAACTFRDDTVLQDNTATAIGGAVAGLQRTNVTCTKGCNARSNYAPQGGAFSISGATSLTVDASSTVSDNVAEVSGGAVSVQGRSSVALHGTFRGNKIETIGRGGVVFFELDDPSLQSSVENATMASNEADRGGCLFIADPGADVVVTGLRAEGNLATLQGGVIFAGGRVRLRAFNNRPFVAEGNEARSEGAVLACESNGNCVLDHLIARRNVMAIGAIFVDSGALTSLEMTNSVFVGNRAELGGSTISVGSLARALLIDVESRDDVSQGGVVVGNPRSNVTLIRLAIDNATVTSSSSGAITAVSAENLRLVDSSVTNIQGRAMSVATVTYLSMTGVRFERNTGPVDLEGTTAVMSNAQFLSNTNGGLRVAGGAVTVTDTVFSENDGSALVVTDGAQVMLANAEFRANSVVSLNGGAVTVSDARLNVSSTIFEANRAAAGGAVAVESNGIFTLDDSELRDNVAVSGDGGAVHLSGGATLVLLSRVIAQGNAAPNGGGGVLQCRNQV